MDPLQQLGDQREPAVNDHDTALLISDDLGGHFAVITRGSTATALTAYRRWSDAADAAYACTMLVLFGVLPASLGWVLGSWIVSAEILTWDAGSLGANLLRFLVTYLAVGVPISLVLSRTVRNPVSWLYEATFPELYGFDRPLGTTSITPAGCLRPHLFTRDVLGHASWETGVDLTMDQRDALVSSSGDAADLAAREDLNLRREESRRTRTFGEHPLSLAQSPSLSSNDVITHAHLDYVSGDRGVVVTTVRLRYADGRTKSPGLHRRTEPRRPPQRLADAQRARRGPEHLDPVLPGGLSRPPRRVRHGSGPTAVLARWCAMCEQQATPTPELVELREALEDCRARIRGTGLGAQEWLDLRWAELNATRRPLWMLRDVRVDRPGHPHDVALVPVPLIVQGGGEARWGDVDNRGDSYRQIVQGLLDSSTKEWLHRMGSVSLERYDGPLGPTYAVCSDGRHRVHTAKALDLPYLNARIDQVWPAPEVRDLLVSANRKHVSLLAELGYLENYSPRDNWPTGTLTTPLEVPWALEPPKSVARISRDYATVYPEFREHPFYQLTATPEAAGTLEYLTLHAPAPPPPETSPSVSSNWWSRLREMFTGALSSGPSR